MSGGTALLALAALLAFWPRRGTTPGYPIAAAVALGTLYAVPIIEHGPDSPYFDGALFCILLAGFLWLERVRSDQLGVATACVVATAIVGAIIAPRLDSTRPWFNYENFAEKLEPTKAEAFSWTHSYGPMTWSRDGREMLRIKATVPGLLEGDQPRRLRRRALARGPAVARRRSSSRASTAAGCRRSRSSIAGCARRSSSAPATCEDILPGASRLALPAERRHLRDLDASPCAPATATRRSSTCRIRPTPSSSASSADYPGYTQDFLELHVPLRGASAGLVDQATGKPLGPNADIRFAPYGTDGAAGVVWPSGFGVQQDGDRVMADSPYAQLYALTQQIRREHQDALRLRAGRPATACSRAPPTTRTRRSAPTRWRPSCSTPRRGYCQQFSGVMALMLRMGGVPARVASGFSPGSYNSERKDYVVRDTDAHSWVEAYFPPYGWITFDPTPGRRRRPARSSTTPARAPTAGRRCRPTSAGAWASRATARSRPATPAPAVAPTSGGGGWKLPVGAGARRPRWRSSAPSRCGAGARRSRRSRPSVAELQRALHRSGRDPSPDVTLARAGERARRLRGGRGLRARACATARYARSTAPPTARAAPRAAPPARLGPRPAGRAARMVGAPAAAARSAQGSSSASVHSEVGMDSAYDLFMNGTALLDNGDFHAAVVPAGARPRPRARQGLGPRGARPRAVRRPALPRGGGGVRGRRRARADQRLRAVLPRPLAAAAGPPRRGAQAAGARLVPAPGARGLLEVPRSGAPPRGLSAPRFRPVAVASQRCYLAATAFGAGPRAGVVESGRSPAFLLSGEEEIDEQPAEQTSRRVSPRRRRMSRCCSPRSSAATPCASSSIIPTASRSPCASASPHLLPEVRERYALEVSSPGGAAPADQARPLPSLPRPPRARAPARRPRRPRVLHRRAGRRHRGGGHDRRRHQRLIAIPYADIRKSNLVEE